MPGRRLENNCRFIAITQKSNPQQHANQLFCKDILKTALFMLNT